MNSNVRPDTMVRITTPELAEAFIAEQIAAVREQVGDKKVLLALSGGVDSSVVAALLIKAIGKQLVCVHVNHGLMRKNESENVIEVFQNQLNANLVYVDATDRFLDLLAGVSDPERKRKIIGIILVPYSIMDRRTKLCRINADGKILSPGLIVKHGLQIIRLNIMLFFQPVIYMSDLPDRRKIVIMYRQCIGKILSEVNVPSVIFIPCPFSFLCKRITGGNG